MRYKALVTVYLHMSASALNAIAESKQALDREERRQFSNVDALTLEKVVAEMRSRVDEAKQKLRRLMHDSGWLMASLDIRPSVTYQQGWSFAYEAEFVKETK